MKLPIVSILTASALLTSASFAQAPDPMQKLDPQKHRELMPIHARMLEEQKKQDAELAPLLAAMNAASGEKRVDALITVVNKLVEQRKAMQEMMAGSLGR